MKHFLGEIKNKVLLKQSNYAFNKKTKTTSTTVEKYL